MLLTALMPVFLGPTAAAAAADWVWTPATLGLDLRWLRILRALRLLRLLLLR